MENAEISASAIAKVRLDVAVGAAPPAIHPDAASIVYDIKETIARAITLIEQFNASQAGVGNAASRECSIAVTHLQTAAMFATYAVTVPAQ